MTQDEGIKTLIQAVIVAQSKGAYSLDESSLILQAVRLLTSPAPVEENK